VSKHLGIPQAACTLSEPIEWRHGSFNTCLPVWIHHPQAPRRVIVRFPLPYRVGESHFPGNVEEKVRTEAATYIWLQSKCPSVPIPRFFAFGLPGTQCVSHSVGNIADLADHTLVHATRDSVILERCNMAIAKYRRLVLSPGPFALRDLAASEPT